MFSSIAQLRLNLINILITTPGADDVSVTDRINHADDDILMDLGKYVNFDSVPAAGYSDLNFPIWLNHLSQYQTCIHVLAKLYGAKRQADTVSDVQYWQGEYDKLSTAIKMNRSEAVLPDGTNISKGIYTVKPGRTNIAPVLGSGAYGKFAEESELSKIRPRGESSITDDVTSIDP